MNIVRLRRQRAWEKAEADRITRSGRTVPLAFFDAWALIPEEATRQADDFNNDVIEANAVARMDKVRTQWRSAR